MNCTSRTWSGLRRIKSNQELSNDFQPLFGRLSLTLDLRESFRLRQRAGLVSCDRIRSLVLRDVLTKFCSDDTGKLLHMLSRERASGAESEAQESIGW